MPHDIGRRSRTVLVVGLGALVVFGGLVAAAGGLGADREPSIQEFEGVSTDDGDRTAGESPDEPTRVTGVGADGDPDGDTSGAAAAVVRPSQIDEGNDREVFVVQGADQSPPATSADDGERPDVATDGGSSGVVDSRDVVSGSTGDTPTSTQVSAASTDSPSSSTGESASSSTGGSASSSTETAEGSATETSDDGATEASSSDDSSADDTGSDTSASSSDGGADPEDAVEFRDCETVTVEGSFESVEVGTVMYWTDGVDTELRSYDDVEGTTTLDDIAYGGVSGYFVDYVALFEADGSRTTVENPDAERCDERIRPERPTVEFAGAEDTGDGELRATFAYENPNDHRLDLGTSVSEGTVEDRYPVDTYEPGEGEFTVTWTPEDEDERLELTVSLAPFGHADVVVESPPAGEYMESSSGSSTPTPTEEPTPTPDDEEESASTSDEESTPTPTPESDGDDDGDTDE